MIKAYSYIRFSSKIQEKGDSIRRQRALAQKYAEQHNMVISELPVDDGISAFSGKNLEVGSLGKFIEDVKSGVIATPTILLVEQLDRLSRGEKRTSGLELLKTIVEYDVDIITTASSKRYNKDNVWDFETAISAWIESEVASKESKKKSERSNEVWNEKRENARNKKIAMTANCPEWLFKQGNIYIIDELQAEPYRVILEMYLAGNGYYSITRHLNKHYPRTTNKNRKVAAKWYDKTVAYFLKNPALVGVWRDIPDYYPRLITDEEYAKIQATLSARYNAPKAGKRGAIVNIFQSLLKCEQCGGGIIRLNRSYKCKNDKVSKYVYTCDNARYGSTDCTTKTWELIDAENYILKCISELDIASIIPGDENQKIKSISGALLLANQRLESTKKKIKRNHDAMEADDDEDFDIKVYVRRAKELQKEEKELNNNVEELSKQYENELNLYANMQAAKNNICTIAKFKETDENRLKLADEIKKIVNKIIMNCQEQHIDLYYQNGIIKSYYAGTQEATVFSEDKGGYRVISSEIVNDDMRPNPAFDERMVNFEFEEDEEE